jgi:hypothetical protein
MNYYLYFNGEQAGPYAEEDVVLMVASGQVSATDLAWREGMEEWLPIEVVMTLTPQAPVAPPPHESVSPPPKSAASAAAGFAFRKYWIFIALIVVLVVAAYSISPFWAVHRLRQAAESKDAVYITDSVDFPVFRESLKGALSAQMAKEAAASHDEGGFGAMGAAFGAMMVGPLVDALVTPEAVIGLMQGKDLGAVSGGAAAGGAPDESSGQEQLNEVSTSMRYEGLNRFVVSATDEDKKAASLVFQRHGLFSWKLSGIRLQGE